MTTFQSLDLVQPLLFALEAEGYETPTPIQMQAIPPALKGNDLLGIAQTGTGKTAAFALPILNHLIANPAPRRKMAPRTLILAPTRELVTQIAESFRSYARFVKLSVVTVFGGVPIPRQEKQLFGGTDVLVATPGRLLDLVDRGSLLLDQVEILVLDEADQMLDLGFIHALKRIAQIVPRRRQSLFFSATMPNSISDLSSRFLTDPVKVEVTPVATTAERIKQSVTFLNQSEKQALLTLTLRQPEFEKCLVFTRTKHGADRVVRHLQGAGIRSSAIHGNKSQPQRERALQMFREGMVGVLVATDIAARGIDIDSVSHVINFELPNVPEQYVHRIGRTARAGREGVALSFCAPDEKAYLRDIEKLTRQKILPNPLPANFLAEAAKLPKPVPANPERGEYDDYARGRDVGTHRHAARPTDPRRQGGPNYGEGRGRPQRGGRPGGFREERGQFYGELIGDEATSHAHPGAAGGRDRFERPARAERPGRAGGFERREGGERGPRPEGRFNDRREGGFERRGDRPQGGEGRPPRRFEERSDRPQGERQSSGYGDRNGAGGERRSGEGFRGARPAGGKSFGGQRQGGGKSFGGQRQGGQGGGKSFGGQRQGGGRPRG